MKDCLPDLIVKSENLPIQIMSSFLPIMIHKIQGKPRSSNPLMPIPNLGILKYKAWTHCFQPQYWKTDWMPFSTFANLRAHSCLTSMNSFYFWQVVLFWKVDSFFGNIFGSSLNSISSLLENRFTFYWNVEQYYIENRKQLWEFVSKH